jgi:hypothetical protein
MSTRAQQSQETGHVEEMSEIPQEVVSIEDQLASLLEQQNSLAAENTQLCTRLAESTPLPREHATFHTPLPSPEHQHSARPFHEPSMAPTTFSTATSHGRTSEPKVSQPEYFNGQRNKLKTFIL